MDSRVARRPIENMEIYKNQLKHRLDPSFASVQLIFEAVRKHPQRIVFAEGEEEDKEDESGALIKDTSKKEKQYPSLLVVTENGFGKQTYLAEYRKTNRAASGVKTLNMTKKTGKPVLVQILNGTEESLIVTTKNGITIRVSPEEISQLGRSTQGIKIIRVLAKDFVVAGSVS
jgi:DNA gyrase/topoisomerase IV subunit A